MKIDPSRRSVSLDPRDPEFFNDPYRAYHVIRAQAPMFKWEQYGHWCFARHEDVSALLRDRRFGRQIPYAVPEPPAHLEPFYAFERHSLLENEPPVHTRLRNLVNRAFLSREIDRLRPRVESLANQLIDHFAADRQTDLIASFATPIPVTIVAEMLGVPSSMAPQLLAWSHDMVAMYQARRDSEIERKAAAATVAFSDFMRACVGERRSKSGNDLLSHLIAAEAEGSKLSEDELITTAILLLNAGHEATVHAIGNGVKALLENGITQIGAGHVEEMLRFDAPLHLFTRYALADSEFRDLRLRKGETVGLLLGAANRDPARFPEPDRFEPSRTPNPHVSFGAGIHFCVGAPLARLELAVALPILFGRLPQLAIASPPRYRDSYHFHGLEALDLSWAGRVASGRSKGGI
jgi:cytochrome P450